MNLFDKKYQFVIYLLSCFCTAGFAQDKIERVEANKDTLASESVLIIKTFNPTINDAFKISPTPNFDDGVEQEKSLLDYTINSVPVASTFEPEKTKSVEVKREKVASLYNNYASLGAGNLGNVRAEFFSRLPIDRQSEFSVLLQHHSSQGGIDEVVLDDFFYDTGLQLAYSKNTKRSQWNSDIELQHQLYNWYGVPQPLTLTDVELAGIDPSHSFINASVGGSVTLDDGILRGVSTRFRHFRDNFDSAENNFKLSPEFSIELENQEITGAIVVDYLGGSFDANSSAPKSDYSILNLGISPSIALTLEEINLQIGFSGYVTSDFENKKTRLFVYPNIKASYDLPYYGVSVFGGVVGDLSHNSYYKAANENLFVAPQLVLSPTSTSFNTYAGAKGSAGNFGYEAQVSLKSAKDQALWVKNPSITPANVGGFRSPFTYGNSFSYVYDRLNIVGGTLKLSYEEEGTYGVSIGTTFNSYSTKDQAEAWNLPSIQANIEGNYVITPQWKAGVNLFYVGERKDIDTTTLTTTTLSGYFDANVRIDYRINKQWQAFALGNNLTGQNYTRWQDYPVQGLQLLVGVKYLFNYK